MNTPTKSSKGWLKRVIALLAGSSGLSFILSSMIREKYLILFLLPEIFNDGEPLTGSNLLARIYGKRFGDKCYISQSLLEKLFIVGIHLITKLKKNMKNSLMHMSDKILLRKRALVETVCDELKIICQIEHTRLRSQKVFIINLLSGMIAYSYLPKKPSLNLEVFDRALALT